VVCSTAQYRGLPCIKRPKPSMHFCSMCHSRAHCRCINRSRFLDPHQLGGASGKGSHPELETLESAKVDFEQYGAVHGQLSAKARSCPGNRVVAYQVEYPAVHGSTNRRQQTAARQSTMKSQGFQFSSLLGLFEGIRDYVPSVSGPPSPCLTWPI
jgi:hypothetical protein